MDLFFSGHCHLHVTQVLRDLQGKCDILSGYHLTYECPFFKYTCMHIAVSFM